MVWEDGGGNSRLLPDVRPAGALLSSGLRSRTRPTRGTTSLHGKGVHREVGSEGSRRQSGGAAISVTRAFAPALTVHLLRVLLIQ